MEHNINNAVGRCICSFSYGIDRIWIFEVPDENRGYYSGWLFLVNTTPYFWSIAGGSEGLNNYIASAYAEYLANDQGDMESVVGNADDGWELDDDTILDFDATFCDAMMDAGYQLEEDTGRWVQKDEAIQG